MSKNEINKFWAQGLTALNCDITDKQLDQLKQYVQLLQRWNKIYNLTAIRDPLQMIPLHIFDSLAIAPYIQGKTCLDVGSGAGLPGIPLAIIQPHRFFTLLDTNGKKTRFMQQVIIQLGLKNSRVIQTRIENWRPDNKFHTIISRAFASLIDFLSTSSFHLSENGQMLAMKGQLPTNELSTLPKPFIVEYSKTLQVPDVSADRCIIKIIRETELLHK
jgi:16S rRNA (guanine527-N7)-methyltransferase